MNLVIDWGNSFLKLGWFDGPTLIEAQYGLMPDDLASQVSKRTPDHVLISSTSRPADELKTQMNHLGETDGIVMTSATPVPVRKAYDTPHSLGADRLAAAVGAVTLFPGTDCLVIDMGTCITADFVDQNQTFQGGLISPGLRMRLQAMHTFTERLPLVEVAEGEVPLLAKNTRQALQSGAVNGMLFEVQGIIDQYRQTYPALNVLICGGDMSFFESRLKPTIFAVPELVLIGLNRILTYNVRNLQVE